MYSIANSIRFELWLKRKLQRLEIYDSYFHNVFHYSGSILILVNRQGQVIELNRTGQESFKVRADEIINRDVRKLIGHNSNLGGTLKEFSVNKINLQTSMGTEAYSMECVPIYDQAGYEHAFLLKLEKKKAFATITKPTSFITKYSFGDIIGESEKMEQLVGLARKVSRTQSNILIEGETGTGKELFAQAIHNESGCAKGPFVAINCAAIPNELIESELFGYEKGAYSGARREGNTGKFELANEGTLFLDEIHAMDISAQMKILRVIEDRALTRIGGKSLVPLNIRIVAACSQRLREEVEKGNFLAALYFRLNVVSLRIPPLRERKDDIPPLVDYFIETANLTFRRSISGITPEAMDVILQYSWPGNVRELKNCIDRAFNVAEGRILTVEDIFIDEQETGEPEDDTEKSQTVEGITRNLIAESLERCDNVKDAAQSMGISVSTFYRKMKKFGLGK